MKLTKSHLRKIIKEEISKVLNEDGEDGEGEDDIGTPGGSQVLKPGDLEALVQREFQAWQEEQKANRNKFQPGLGAGGSAGKAATHRSEVFDKVKRTLIQDYGFMDIDVGTPIYKEIYTILYDLIPRPRRY